MVQKCGSCESSQVGQGVVRDEACCNALMPGSDVCLPSVANEKLLKPLKYLNDFKIGWKREQVEVYTETMKKWTRPWQWALN